MDQLLAMRPWKRRPGDSALIGGALLVALPRYGYNQEASRTLLFAYATISQLVLAYSARRIVTAPQANLVLHLTVLVCMGLQLLTVFVPGLRWVLGLELIDPYALTWVGATVLVSWGAAEIYSRVAIASDWLRKKRKRTGLDDKIGEVLCP